MNIKCLAPVIHAARLAAMTDVEIRDVAPGLWLWRQPHPDWRPGLGWEAPVSSFVVEARGEVVVIDPLAAPPRETALWERLDAVKPTIGVVMKPDHVRDIDLFVRWYGVRAFGPDLYFRHDIPNTELEDFYAGDELPGGLVAQFDARRGIETPLYAPDHRALIFADAMHGGDEGTLRIWHTPWHERIVLPVMRRMLELPFEHVLVSHGEPVHTRAEFEAALERDTYREEA